MPSSDSEVIDGSQVNSSEADQETGLEVEHDESFGSITDPFDPEQINIRTVHLLIDQLVSRIRYGEIDLTPDFQRLRGIWSLERKSRLIESLLLRIPIPVFYVAGQDNDDWAVVDGLQRMSTIDDYANGMFALERLEYLTSLNGHKYESLPRPMQRRINETQLIVNVIEPSTPPEVMFNVFLRINTGGMTLNGQEIRHALHSRGPVREFLKRLAESNEFLTATTNSVRPTRMADRECVLRFLAFYMSPHEYYSTNDLDMYLSAAMKKINAMSRHKRNDLAKVFKNSMSVAFNIFGDDAFRKRTNWMDSKRPVNRALFEVWGVQLAKCSEEEIEVIVSKSKEVRQRFVELMCSDAEFERSISSATGVPQRVHKRFGAIEQLLKEVVEC